jgi:hypothetical protein
MIRFILVTIADNPLALQTGEQMGAIAIQRCTLLAGVVHVATRLQSRNAAQSARHGNGHVYEGDALACLSARHPRYFAALTLRSRAAIPVSAHWVA